mgnify:CR=1 FL=1
MYFWEENKMSLIKGIHHVALRPTYAQFEKAKTFYLDPVSYTHLTLPTKA